MLPLPLIADPTPPPTGKQYWRTLEERADTSQFRELLAREFPEQAGLLHDPVSRRQFLTLMGASLTLAGVTGCGRQASNDKIVPAIRQPEQLTQGRPLYFATAMPMPGGATGLLVESHEGRPTKIEGNLDHPASLGATDAMAQASVLGLYDPDRARALTHLGRVVGWNDALAALQKEMTGLIAKAGAGFALLTPSINSPTLAAQTRELQKVFPAAKWYVHEPAVPDNSRQAAKSAFGEALDLVYRVADADVILTLDADFLASGPNHLRYAREFIQRRKLKDASDVSKMNRLYAVESTPMPTGTLADHRLPLRAGQIESFARTLAGKLGALPDQNIAADSKVAKFLDVLARDLQTKVGKSLVVAGPLQPPAVHALVHAINAKLGNLGKTVLAVPAIDQRPEAGLQELATSIDAGEVQLLLILSCNPVYSSPADLDFAAKMQKVRLRVRLGLYDDETGALCHWNIPEAHYLESWSDALGPDGTATIIQPLIAPLYAGKSAHEVIAAFSNQPNRPSRDIVRDYWKQWHSDKKPSESFDAFFRKSIHDGVVAGSVATPITPTLKSDWQQSLAGRSPEPLGGPAPVGYEIIFHPDPYLFDGRFANNGWLQELPRPMTKLVWDNAALVSPATANALGITTGPGPHGGGHGEVITQLVTLTYQGRSLNVPAFILPGHADGAVTLHLGFGRTLAGRVGSGVGVNAYKLCTNESFARGLDIKLTGQSYTLGCTQFHHVLMTERDLVRSATAAEFVRDPSCTPAHAHGHNEGHYPKVEGFGDELYTNPETKGRQWGMSVDLGACHGCGACVAACQAENNIPIVGKEMVTRGREMHWLRIDRYYSGDESNPETHLQPVMCMHCENAPCEVVCPVEATSHSPDGLNEMTYNRCVGTRYCANNCPYKVRRFNFLQYTDYASESLKLLRNPDVSVRSRGVMEKCTYCVQRIRTAEIEAKNHGRGIADGEIVTACQAACPTEAIIFGDINDRTSRVSRLKALPRDYGILTELNTKPRTTYLAAVKNPNPELA